jgi:hypothetical protein
MGLRHQAPRSGQRVGEARLEKQPLDAGRIAREQRLDRRHTADRDKVALVRPLTGWWGAGWWGAGCPLTG